MPAALRDFLNIWSCFPRGPQAFLDPGRDEQLISLASGSKAGEVEGNVKSKGFAIVEKI